MEARRILAALADLAPAGGERVLDVSRGGQRLVWLSEPDRAPRNRTVDRLAALDALHRDERILRRGWGFVVGATELDGARRTVRLPLVAQPVRLDRGLRGYRVVPAGDLELTALVADRELAARLEAEADTAAWGWLPTAARAAGLPVARVETQAPRKLPEDELIGIAAAALFVSRDVRSVGLRATLLTWSTRPDLQSTALTAVYGDAEPRRADPEGPVRSPLPLNAGQREAVRRARTEPVAVVSGPPGTGKSHAVVAAALDIVDRGGSVLVAAQSTHAVDALGDLLRRYPGPAPVLFGDSERREAIVAELGRGLGGGVRDARLRADAEAVATAEARLDAIRAGIASALEIERCAATLPEWEPLLPALRVDAPRFFEPGADLVRTRRLVGREGWWARWRLRPPRGRFRWRTPGSVAGRAGRRGGGPGGRAPRGDRWHRPRPGLAGAGRCGGGAGRGRGHGDARPGEQRATVEPGGPA